MNGTFDSNSTELSSEFSDPRDDHKFAEMRKEQSRVSGPSNRQFSSKDSRRERKETCSVERRKKFSYAENDVECFSSGSDEAVPITLPPMLTTTSKGRSKYKRQRPVLNVSGEADLLIDMDCESDCEDSPCYHAPSEHLLSDHTAIDVLMLEAEMRTVLSDLEAFGITDDDYGSLALTSEEEKVESDSWPTVGPSALSYKTDVQSTEESSLIVNEEAKEEEDEDDDWEILSDEGSAWTVDTLGTKCHRDALPMESLKSTTATKDSETTMPEKHSAQTAVSEERESGPRICVEILENADIWTSIRDTIRTLGGGKQSLLFRK